MVNTPNLYYFVFIKSGPDLVLNNSGKEPDEEVETPPRSEIDWDIVISQINDNQNITKFKKKLYFEREHLGEC